MVYNKKTMRYLAGMCVLLSVLIGSTPVWAVRQTISAPIVVDEPISPMVKPAIELVLPDLSQPEEKDEKALQNNPVDEVYLKPYMKRIERGILRHWDPPRTVSPYKVTLRLLVNKKGMLEDIYIWKSSGSQEIDAYARKTVISTAPFRPFPRRVTRDVATIQFTLHYTGEPGHDGQ